MKRIALSGLAGSICMFFLGAVGHGVLLRHYREGLPRERPILPIVYASVLVLAACMAIIYSRVSKGSVLKDGLLLGLVFAVAWTVPGGLARFGALEGVDLGKVFADAAWHLVEEGVGGVAIVWVQQRLQRGAPART